MLTAWLVHRRDTAAQVWLAEVDRTRALQRTTKEKRSMRRLIAWDTLLGIWTHNGTRRL